jgi:N-acetyl-anhydromuramyl-L-alanine amidase AmpD
MNLLACALALAACAAPAASASSEVRRPTITWLRGEGNFTKSHRGPTSIDCIVVHATEGSFWGSVGWLRNERAHASSHFIVARSGRIVQLVHLSDIAWHAGNWRVNAESVGIEHEGWTDDPSGFTPAQYRASARLAAYIARRSLMPIDRAHIIGHSQVPAPGGGWGGSSHHTDPGRYWNWTRYLQLVRRYAHPGPRLTVETRLRPGPLRGVVGWGARTKGGVRRVEFAVDGRVLWVDRRAPFSFLGGRGLNTVTLGNGRHVLELRAYGDGTRHDVTRRGVVVGNRAFVLTSAGARSWTRVRGVVRLRVRVWGAKADAVVVRVDGDRLRADRRPPYAFRWDSRRRRDGRHLLSLRAVSVDGRRARRDIPVVVDNHRATRPRPKPTPSSQPRPLPLSVTGGSIADGQTLRGFVLWRADIAGRASRVEFRVDGELRGADLQRPFTLGWDASADAPGRHALLVRAIGRDGRVAERRLSVTVAPPA